MKPSYSQQDLVQLIELNQKSYPRLGKKQIFGLQVVKVEVKGNCCWGIYSGPKFTNDFQFLRLGFFGTANFEIMSLLKAECV